MAKKDTKAPKKAPKAARKEAPEEAPKKVHKKVPKRASQIDPEKISIDVASNTATQEIQGWEVQTINEDGMDDVNLKIVIQVFKTHMSTLNNQFYTRLTQLCTMVTFDLRSESKLGTIFKIMCEFLDHTKFIIDINLDQATIHFGTEYSHNDTDHNMIRSFWLLLKRKLVTAGFAEVGNVHSDNFTRRIDPKELFLHSR
jgi:hypothetical protein